MTQLVNLQIEHSSLPLDSSVHTTFLLFWFFFCFQFSNVDDQQLLWSAPVSVSASLCLFKSLSFTFRCLRRSFPLFEELLHSKLALLVVSYRWVVKVQGRKFVLLCRFLLPAAILSGELPSHSKVDFKSSTWKFCTIRFCDFGNARCSLVEILCVCVTMKRKCQSNGKHDKRYQRYFR